jgi:hypothetical protein
LRRGKGERVEPVYWRENGFKRVVAVWKFIGDKKREVYFGVGFLNVEHKFSFSEKGNAIQAKMRNKFFFAQAELGFSAKLDALKRRFYIAAKQRFA